MHSYTAYITAAVECKDCMSPSPVSLQPTPLLLVWVMVCHSAPHCLVPGTTCSSLQPRISPGSEVGLVTLRPPTAEAGHCLCCPVLLSCSVLQF